MHIKASVAGAHGVCRCDTTTEVASRNAPSERFEVVLKGSRPASLKAGPSLRTASATDLAEATHVMDRLCGGSLYEPPLLSNLAEAVHNMSRLY